MRPHPHRKPPLPEATPKTHPYQNPTPTPLERKKLAFNDEEGRERGYAGLRRRRKGATFVGGRHREWVGEDSAN